MNTKLNHIQNWPELASQANWSVSALAKMCGVSVRTLERHLLVKIGKTPKYWLAEQRQHQATELFEQGLSVKEAADVLHYKHPSHLTNNFKKQCGHSPMNKVGPPYV